MLYSMEIEIGPKQIAEHQTQREKEGQENDAGPYFDALREHRLKETRNVALEWLEGDDLYAENDAINGNGSVGQTKNLWWAALRNALERIAEVEKAR